MTSVSHGTLNEDDLKCLCKQFHNVVMSITDLCELVKNVRFTDI